MHNVGSAGEALSYFSQDNYYTQREGVEESEWFGRGARALGLQGPIEKEAFFDALQGRVVGQELGRMLRNEETGELERQHRPGLDVTFSAPKSVSLLAEIGGSKEVRQAHEEAVKAALGYVERELTYTRQMVGGELSATKTDNVVVALFRHNTSRDLDPQTHTHALLLNATRREDGQWRSVMNDPLYEAQRVVGAVYTAELAHRLQRLGYELRRTDDRGNFEIAAITREQVEHFSQRRAAMEAAMRARGIDIGQASAQQKEAAALSTRGRKTEVDHAWLIASWKQRAAELGIDLDAIVRQAEATRQAGGVARGDRLTGRAAMEFAAATLVEREAVMRRHDLLRTAIEHGAGRVAPREIERAFGTLEREGHLLQLPDGNYTTRRMLGSETWALDQVRSTKGTTTPLAEEAHVRTRLAGLERRQGFAYTAGQTDAIVTVLTSQDRFVAVQGLAGTGKTTMLRGLRELAEEAGFAVRGMAPTGAASKVLAAEAGIAADTVSMFQIRERQLQRDLAFATQYAPGFQRRRELWVVDESSFLSQVQKARLDHMALGAGAKVVYLGDRLQLQGVEAGKPFELAQREGITTAHMTEISRQKMPELRVVVDTLTGRDRLEPEARLTALDLRHNARAFDAMDKAGMVRQVDGGNARVLEALVADIVSMPASERARTLVVTPYNSDRRAINEGVRDGLKACAALGRHDDPHRIYVSKGWTRARLKEAQYYRPGDVVRFGRTYKAIDALKGEYMRVVQVEAAEGRVTLERDGGARLAWEPRKHNSVEVYEAEERPLAAGDLIRFTRNDEHVKNGEVARVVALRGNAAEVELRQGDAASRLSIDLSRSRHWDHAYASTIHASQGSTAHRTVFHIPTPEHESERQQQRQLAAMAKVFGARSFYVGVTRASHDLCVYTGSKAAARQAVAGHQDKTSAYETSYPSSSAMPSAKSGMGIQR